MDYVWWELSLLPPHGWIVRRFVRRGSLFGACEMEYERLTRREADDVLEAELTAVLTGELEI